MGFSRFLQNKPLNLSGIKQFTPDLTQAEKTLESITSGYDEVQALSNAIPEYMQGDSERMRAKQDEYRAGIQNTADAFANQGAQAGNALLRNMKSIIQSDFSTTGEVYGMGNNFKQRQLMKDQLIANKVPSELAKAYLDKNVPASSFDADGKFQRYEAGVAPTVPNYAEIAINAASNMLPDKSLIEEIITDENGIPTHIKQVGKDIVKIADIKSALVDIMESHPEVQNSREAFGDVIDTKIAKAISGASKLFSKDDETLKYRVVAGADKGGKGKINKVPTSDGTGYILEVGQVLVEDEKLKYREENKTDSKGNIIEDEYLDKNISNDAVEIKKNLDTAAITTENVKGDLVTSANGNLAETIINHKYISKTDFSDPTAAINTKPSEYYMGDVYVEDALNLGIAAPETRYEQGIQNYTIATAMQDASKGTDNFLLTTKAELEAVKNTDQMLELFKSKTDGIPESEIQALLNTYDEADIAEKFNRSIAKADKVVNNRNRILNRKEVIEQEVDQAWRGDLVTGDIKLLDGKNLTNDEWAQVAKHHGKEGALTNIFGVAQDKAGVGLKIENLNKEAAELNEVITQYEKSIQESGATGNSKLQQTLDSKKSELERIEILTKQQERLLENSPDTSNKLEKFKEKHLDYLENYDKSKYIANAVKNNYKSVQIRNVFTNLNTTGGVPNLQGSPGSNSKLNTIQKVEHSFAAQLGAIESGTGKDATYRPSSGFDLGSIINVSSGKRLSEEITEDNNIVGVEYLGLSRDAEGTYEMIGRTQIVDKEGNITTGDRVRVQNPSFDKQYRQLLYSGKPLVIKQATDPLWDELTITNDSFVEDKAILGDGYALRLIKDNNGNTDAIIWDSVGNKMLTDGKLENLKDSYDLADRLGGILRGNIAKSYDKDLDWSKLQSYEDGFQANNIKFAKDGEGAEQVERRALDPEFGDRFNKVFGNLESTVEITSMLRSLDNQKQLDKSYNNNNAGPQYHSGHLFGKGIDVAATTQLLQELDNLKDFDVKEAKAGYVDFRGFKIWIHGKEGRLHLDIKNK
tara:strand:- start:3238 stop:6348 length:3111 start_codon:yes stop_codon:yes gene_type:complete